MKIERSPLSNRFIYEGSLLVVFLTFVTMLIGIYLLFIPIKAFEVDGNSKILTPVVKAGEVVSYQTTYCKHENVPAVISKTLVDGILIPFAPYTSNVGIGCNSTVVFNTIPKFTPPGTYFIRILNSFRINSIRTTSYEYRTDDFEVIK